MKPLVSIITPSFNQAIFLERTILSVLNQDYPHIEYIIMDGGSTDGSVEIVKKYEDKISHWQSEKDLGQTDAINKGFSKANGQIFAWLNSDDTYETNAVSQAVEYLIDHPEVGMVYGDCNFIDANDRIIGKFNAKQTNYEKLKTGYVHIPQQASFWRAELWHQVAPLDPSIYFAMDYDLWLRLAKISKIVYSPKLWANFRLHGEAKSISEDDRCWPDMLEIHYRNGGKWWQPIVWKYWIRKLIAPVIQYKRKRMIQK
ncbi:MAG TPA: glycosyltransferase family 2 protein [Anaerolineaceae bacterium]|nr:glycosyltransferase family 2 protein [Anaerolineaceae bacterium]